tara:strand:+ start:348 stop:509 length:162 start_codon:yes stop_codon:yes gene_type:complete
MDKIGEVDSINTANRSKRHCARAKAEGNEQGHTDGDQSSKDTIQHWEQEAKKK